MCIVLCACSSNKLLSEQLTQKFHESKTDDLQEMMEELATVPEFNCEVMQMEEGYIPGFDEDINGFTQAVAILPMINTIPFVCVVFEVEDVNFFKEELKKKANPRWNICTQAEELVMESKGNVVFFLMCTNENL
ncbi:hypothetical protein [Floccifex sp.]|uniref:hypothetical protein n=1 Tax=Floccifex sp. TaxID=2815810 RepID=UPI003F032ED0